MDEIAGPLTELRQAGRHQQVYFSDLYHFFIPGEEIYSIPGAGSGEQPQAYRILHVTGGRRFNLLGKPKDETPEELLAFERGSPFVITCIHIDYNGRELGPVTTAFRINEYSGVRDTAHLPVWPLSFLKHKRTLKKELEMRGQRFVELAQISHKEYTGLALNSNEDIDSQVIIDFDTAVQINRSWAPNFDFQCKC